MNSNRDARLSTAPGASGDQEIVSPHLPRAPLCAPATEIGQTGQIPTILRLPGVKAQTGYSRSTIYLRISQGLWPRPVSLGARSVGWPASEVAAINAARIVGMEDDEIRELVVSLKDARKEYLR